MVQQENAYVLKLEAERRARETAEQKAASRESFSSKASQMVSEAFSKKSIQLNLVTGGLLVCFHSSSSCPDRPTNQPSNQRPSPTSPNSALLSWLACLARALRHYQQHRPQGRQRHPREWLACVCCVAGWRFCLRAAEFVCAHAKQTPTGVGVDQPLLGCFLFVGTRAVAEHSWRLCHVCECTRCADCAGNDQFAVSRWLFASVVASAA